MAEVVNITVEPIDETVTVGVNPTEEAVTVTVAPIDETVTIVVTEGGEALPVNIDINGNEYLLDAEGNVDIPVVDTAANPVGTINGLNVVIADTVVTIQKDGVTVDTENVLAEGALTIEARDYIPKINISPVTYTNTSQTAWVGTADAQNQGAPVDSTPDNPNETGTFAILVSTPAGVSINASTGVVTYTFASLASGATTFTVRKTGTGNYTGTQDYSITITKRTRWLPQSQLANIRLDGSWDFINGNGSSTGYVNSGGEITGIINMAGTTWSQATVSRRMTSCKSINSRNIIGTAGQTNKGYTGNLSSNFNSVVNFFYSGVIASDDTEGILASTGNFIRVNGLALEILVGSGTTVTYTLTEAQWSLVNCNEVVVRITYWTGLNACEIYGVDGLIFSGTNALVEANVFATTNLVYGATTAVGANPLCGKHSKFHTVEQAMTTDEIEKTIKDHRYDLGQVTEPPFV